MAGAILGAVAALLATQTAHASSVDPCAQTSGGVAARGGGIAFVNASGCAPRKLVIAGGRAPVDRGGRFRLVMACLGGDAAARCTGRLTIGATLYTLSKSSKRYRASHARLLQSPFSIGAGAHAVRLRLSPRARRTLRTFNGLKVQVKATAGTLVATQTIRLSPPPKRRR